MSNTNEILNLINLIETYGIEKVLDIIDIENIEDLTIKIILRTLKHSYNQLMVELTEASL